MYEHLPSEIKKKGRFILWRYEERKGQKTKVPYQTNGIKADPGNIKCFVSFEEILAAFDNGKYDGLGLFIGGDISAIDVDDCIIDGGLTEMAETIINTMDSYTERSPSGNGVHILFNADGLIYDAGRYYINNRKNHVEEYIAGSTTKYVTLTGDCIRHRGLEKRKNQAIEVAEKYMVRPQKLNTTPSAAAPGSFLSDESVLEKAGNAQNGEKFKRLWDGDCSAFDSQSEADLALCSMLAFWCGGDTEQIDRLFRKSGLYRDKWDRFDYQRDTLRNAINGCGDFYVPVKSDSAQVDFNTTVGTLIETNALGNKRYGEHDIGFGRLFADVYKDIARYVEERKKWFVYDGTRWTADIAGLRIAELGKDLADAMLVYASTLHDEEDRTKVLKWCKKWVQRKYRDVYIREAQSVYPLNMTSFDRDPFLFNCENCTVDIRTGESHEHTPEDFITKIGRVCYDPSASYPRWNSFIDEIMSNEPDKSRYMQKSFGYGLTGNTDYECMFIYYGETTRNGKGTLLESILRIMGDYGLAVRPETIAQKSQTNSHAPSEDIARLAGIRFANISEPGKGLILNSALIKSMTGNDTLNARFLNENSFDFKAEFKMYINTNYLPVITDMTVFSSNRVIIVPFNRHFEEDEQDIRLKSEFASPQARSAILNWLIDGYRMLDEEGFDKPQSVKDAISEYYHDSNKVVQFMEERLEEDPYAEVRTSAVYDEYSQWCKANGCYSENARNFVGELRKLGPVVRRRPKNGGEKTTILVGYRLRDGSEFLS